MIGHGIDGEITAGTVFLEAACEAHTVRMTVIMVGALCPVGRDFYRNAAGDDGDRAVLDTCVNDVLVLEDPVYFFGQGIGCQIVVVRRTLQKRVTDTAADGIGFIACFVQFSDQPQNLCRQRYDRVHMLIL